MAGHLARRLPCHLPAADAPGRGFARHALAAAQRTYAREDVNPMRADPSVAALSTPEPRARDMNYLASQWFGDNH